MVFDQTGEVRRTPRWRTASSAASLTSMQITTRERAKTFPTSAATVAPASRKASQACGERFQTTSRIPDRARLSAIGLPITPSPMNPISSVLFVITFPRRFQPSFRRSAFARRSMPAFELFLVVEVEG